MYFSCLRVTNDEQNCCSTSSMLLRILYSVKELDLEPKVHATFRYGRSLFTSEYELTNRHFKFRSEEGGWVCDGGVSTWCSGVSSSCVGSNDTHSMRVRNSAQRWKGDSWKYTRQGSNAEKE